jgi:hypothetical protein
MKDSQIPRNEIQVFRNEIQADRNKFQIRRNEIQIKSFDFLRRIEPYQGVTPTPHGLFRFVGRFRPQERRRSGRRCLFALG